MEEFKGSEFSRDLIESWVTKNEEPVVKPFKFLEFWTKHPDFEKVIEENWKIDFVGNPFIEFQTNIKIK
ncbi:hypothetical protein H5410_002880 [Solanum commersonii]|uniref:Uncharacterized protein n=1 Tax=Solanum commersonii TaxID=4109 RepID=A0A9J6B3G5_SOLCO|nr:hypothetical protein H5410_002880 [Solanum commersonii]